MKITIVSLALVAFVDVAVGLVRQHPLKRIQSFRERKVADGTWPDYLRKKAKLVGAHGSQPQTNYEDVIPFN